MKKHLTTTKQRLLSLLLSVCMIGTLLPTTTLAEPVDTSDQESLDIITTWQWIDEEDILDPETGSLALPGASEQTPAYFDDVTALLPTQILATVENAEEPITLGDWECDNYPEEGAYQGSYTFTATLPEGYALSEEAEALEVLVELGGAQQWNVTGVSYRSCDENGTNWTTENCTSATEVSSEDTAWGISDTESWYVASGTVTIGSRVTVNGTVHLILADNCNLTINGGIGVTQGNNFTIYAQSDGNEMGCLTIQNVDANNAGIGGNFSISGKITINGGIVSSYVNKSSNSGAAIGGGDSFYGDVTINGGKVTAIGYWGAGIGHGSSATGGSGGVVINGGVVTASSQIGAGIGGGKGGDGKVTIKGGVITATSSKRNGIGSGSLSPNSTVKITDSPVIFASSISDQSGKENNEWSGIIFEGDTGKAYGTSVNVTTDCTIPSGKSLVVAAEQTISIAETATFTNEGTIYNSGTFTGAIANSGTIHNAGSISGASGGTINQYSISIEQTETSCQSATLTLKVNDTAFGESVTYTLSDGEANAVIENGNTLKVTENGGGTPIPVTATFTVDSVSMTRTKDVTITGHDYDNNGFCTDCNGYQPATDNNSDGVYEIGNVGQLYWFAALVNGTNGLTQNLSANAVLTDNIAVNERILVNGELNTSENGSFKSWTPIGNDVKPYTGIFDGQGYTVSGLYVNDVDKKNVGLFGATGSSGKISNVGVVDSYFNGKNSVGGVCGLNKNGTIENCYNKSYVSGAENIGGVCGYNYAHELGTATIKNCHNEGKVSGSDYVGGVCGFNNDDPEGVATIEYCYNTGEVSSIYHVGGVCGWNRSVHGLSEIANCYNMGKVSGTNYVGGVCGYNYSSGGMSSITKCFNTGKVGGTGDSVGGVCGLNSQESGASATVTNCYYIAGCNTEDTIFTCEEGTSKTATWFASGEAAYLLNDSTSENPVWYQNIDNGTADAYPVLDSNHGTVYYGYDDDACQTPKYSNSRLNAEPIHDYTNNNGFCIRCDVYEPATLTTDKYDIDGDGDKDEVYEIGNAGQLYWFAALVNGTDGLTQNLGANAVLTADITVNTGNVANCGGTKQAGWKDWTPIVGNSYPNNYAGTFDGQNHTVSGLYFNDSNVNNVGLFGYIGTNSKISNVGVVDSYFCGKDRVGGVCGSKYGTVENCYSASTVSGEEAVGGVCGDNYKGNLLNCYNTGAVNCSVSGGWYIGGVCGILNDGTIQNCYSTGTVSGSSARTVGSVCGFNSSGTISNCYSDSSKCDKNAVGINNSTVEKTEGKTAAQFASGEVAYLLNGRSSENPVWYQNIDRDGVTADAYPVLDSDHGTVYQCTPCTAVYSNTSGKTVAHTFHVDKNDNTKHTCEKCGYSEAHSTTNFSYSADEETNRITVYCNEGGCDANIGYVELAAPSGTITYDGTAKAATVSDTVDGVDFSTTPITYKQGETTLSSAPKDAGTYTASITLGTGTGAATVSVEFTIDPAIPTISWGMLHGTTWIEMTSMPVTYTGSEIAPNKLVPPTVTLVNGETYSGEISYSYRVQGSSDAFTSGLPTDIGAYEVKASIAADGNYKEAAGTVTLTVNWFSTAEAATLTGQGGSSLSGDNWWAQSVTFTAPDGFTISNSVDGTYGTSFVYDTQTGADGITVTYYLRNSDGEIAQKAATVRVDRTAPTWPADGGISVKENRWKKFLSTISFGLFFKETLEVKASASDSLSGVAAYWYYVDTTGSTTVLSSDALAYKTFTEVAGSGTQTLTSLSSEGSYVVYAYAVDKAGNKSDYVCTNGVVLDRTAPTIRSITTPSKEALTLTDTNAKISFTGSEAGTCFYILSETPLNDITGLATSRVDDKGMTVWTAKMGVSSVEMTTEAKQITLSNLSPNTAYTLYLAAVDQAGNNSIVYSQTFTTCKTMPTITKNPTISGTYGQTVADMTLTNGVAKVGSTVITGTWAVTDSNQTDVPVVGTTATYQVTFSPDSDNYDTVIVPVKPTVSKKAITVTADDKTKTYGQANPAFTYTIPEGALVSGDDNTALGITLTCAANASSPVKAGGYAITGTTNSANYQVTVIPGVLTITKATPVITASNYDKTYGDIKFFLDATDNSAEASLQYAVTESKDPSASPVKKDAVVTVDARGYVTIIGAGTAKITASLPETANYNAASKEITIVVNQADYPPNRPGTAMFVSNSCTHVGDVPLTGDWKWQNGDTVLRPGENGAIAEYIGADKANYAYTTADVSIRKSHDCDHVAGEILYTENGDYAPTCTTVGGGHRKCTICGNLIESGILVNPAHSFSSTWTIDVQPTTTSEGSKSHHCIVCDAKNDITVIPKLVISNGGNSNNESSNNESSGSSSNSGSTTTETPEVKAPESNATPEVTTPAADTTPAPEPTSRPSTTKKQETSGPDTEAPFIKGDNGKEGWDVIRDEVKGATEGSTVVVDMNGASVVPGDVIADIRGKDITLVFDMGDGISWSINGKSITSDQIGEINFSVTVGSSNIPVDVINNVTGERYSKQISLAYDGEFGFTAVLSINMDKKNAGLFANLFYYNETTKELEFICADEIAEDGTAELTFTHASEYTIVVDEEPMDESAQEMKENEEEETGSEAETEEATEVLALEKKGGLPWWIILVCAGVIVAGVGAFFVVRKKKMR